MDRYTHTLVQCTRARVIRKNYSHMPENFATTKSDRLVVIIVITWHYNLWLISVWVLLLKAEYDTLTINHAVLYSHCNVPYYATATKIIASHCLLSKGVLEVTNILDFRYRKNVNIKHAFNDHENLIESHYVDFNINDPSNSVEMVSMFVM